ncbi:hypothetical protein BpHYR1_020522 [Brachionus plicatilis]|uniref:Uncharacterized protein n=1 Tax=Brachionus plicatilis TaxID=10195 RepID=A0A3M7RLW7_BRAPC|nr:hypothetical protein BpHYR1_020522 [Brachionus plicatilis]
MDIKRIFINNIECRYASISCTIIDKRLSFLGAANFILFICFICAELKLLAYAKTRTTVFLLKYGPRSDDIWNYPKASDHRPFCREFDELLRTSISWTIYYQILILQVEKCSDFNCLQNLFGRSMSYHFLENKWSVNSNSGFFSSYGPTDTCA